MTTTTSNNDILERVHLATDIILGINFSKKIIQVESENWTVIAKRNDLASESIRLQQKERETVSSTTQKSSDTATAILEKNIGEKLKDYTPNKKVQLSKDEKIVQMMIEVFDSLSQTSFNDGAVHYKTLRQKLQDKQIVKDYRDFDKFLNMALEQNLIESVEDQHLKGFYRRKKIVEGGA